MAVVLFTAPDGLLPAFLLTAAFYAVTVGLTILIETPVIVRGGVTDNKRYVAAVNIVTNVLLQLSLAGVLALLRTVLGGAAGPAHPLFLLWFAVAELILIPVSEALAYGKISRAGKKRIFAFSYLANLLSCAAGLVLDVLVRKFF